MRRIWKDSAFSVRASRRVDKAMRVAKSSISRVEEVLLRHSREKKKKVHGEIGEHGRDAGQ